ncbi:MAG: metallophosphoesterase [Prevotella sp.]|nr:metallophosphoesterase [Prevotella sp.]
MIARISLWIILLTVFSYWYLEKRYLKKRFKNNKLKRILWWTPGIFMILYTIYLSFTKNFIPDDISVVNIYLFLLGLFVFPVAIYAICSAFGKAWCIFRHTRKNWGNLVGFFLALFSIYVLIYGSTIGIRQLKITKMELAFKDLPAAFDGYRIAVFSDLHAGSFNDSKKEILERDIDSINAQNADAILFLGDIQNIKPSELYPIQDILMKLKAKDGIFSVLGNHDYSDYTNEDPAIEAANEREVVSRQIQFGWNVLRNEHVSIRRGNQSIVIAGEESACLKKSPDKRDINKTLDGISDNAFVILMQHAPLVWKEGILPVSNVQLTLSGHTHGGQVDILGFRPTKLRYEEDYGLFQEDDRMIYVTSGIGALIPFRFGVSPEIAVITLRKK